MEGLWQDLRYAVRLLIRSPGFSLIAILALAFGIGANSAIFSIVNAVLLRPLPLEAPDRLVMIWHNYPALNLARASLSSIAFLDYKAQGQSFSGMEAMSGGNFSLTGQGEPIQIQGNRVSATFFSTLGIKPVLGRVFAPGEDQAGKSGVVVISDGLWQRAFGADPGLVGRQISIDGEAVTVIGVVSSEQSFPPRTELWTPLVFAPEQLQEDARGREFLGVVARLKPGVTFEQAQAEMVTLTNRILKDHPGTYPENGGWKIDLVPLHEQAVGRSRVPLLVLFGAVGFVLLIACANVANLLLARAAGRGREIAVRMALGAGRLRLMRQLLTESVLLALVGGGLGLLLASWAVDLLGKLSVNGLPRATEIDIDPRVMLFTLGLSVATGLLFGLVPAWQVSRGSLHDTLKDSVRGSTGGVHRRNLRGVLVVVEVALALVLLVGAGLLIRSFARLQQVDPGFRPEGAVTLQLGLPKARYATDEQKATFYREALEKIEALPGVRAAGAVSHLPMGNSTWSMSFQVEGQEVPDDQPSPHGEAKAVTPGYFSAIGVPLLQGRAFTARDSADGPEVVIVDESLAKQYWPGQNPIGKRIGWEETSEAVEWREVVGVVKHVMHTGLDGAPKVQFYLPHAQQPSANMSLVVRTETDPLTLLPALRNTIWSVDKELPVQKVKMMSEVVADSLSGRRLTTALLGVFAGVALFLACLGLYGVMAWSVVQRTHEIGIRMALGARPGDVLRMVVGQGMRMVLTGIVAGLVAAFLLTRLMASLLYEVNAFDPLTFGSIAAVLIAVAALACYLPARRAVRIDPLVALRCD